MSLPKVQSFSSLNWESKELLLWTKPRPLWHAILAATCFTLVIFLLYIIVFDPAFSTWYEVEDLFAIFIIMIFGLVVAGVRFSLRNYVYFDLAHKKYKDQYGLGQIRVGKWQELPPIDYVSVFSRDWYRYELNLWYCKTKHITIETLSSREAAIENGFYLARDLGIKLFDASDRNTKNKYLNMAELAKKYLNEDTQDPN